MPHPLPNPLRAFVPQSLRAFLLPLLLGLLTTIVVAWVCAIRTRIDESPPMQHLPAAAPDEHWVWPESTLPGFPSHPTTLWRPRALGLSITWASAYTTRTPDDCTLYRCVSFRAGWPLRALASHLTLVMDNPSGTIFAAHDEPGSAWHGGLQPPLSLVNNDSAFLFLRRLPIRPVLPGLLINTLFYALPIFILLSIPGALRSHLHKRRNLCPNCAYNLRGLPPTSPCPECGSPPNTRY